MNIISKWNVKGILGRWDSEAIIRAHHYSISKKVAQDVYNESRDYNIISRKVLSEPKQNYPIIVLPEIVCVNKYFEWRQFRVFLLT